MALWLDQKYANLLSPYVRNFKRKNDSLWNFSCPECGDSSKNKIKARGYIYKKASALFYMCHNCGFSTNLGNLIKSLDPGLYQEYVMENYRESGAPRSSHKNKEVAIPDIFRAEPKLPVLEDDVLSAVTRLDILSEHHPARLYIQKRKIPPQFYKSLYFTTKFKAYINKIIPDKFPDLQNDHPRLIIPYMNKYGKCFALQGRAFGPEIPKYYTIKIDENAERIYGLDRVDFSQRILVVEGPIDSLFLPNALAVSGSSFESLTMQQIKTNAVLVWDNEPRSPQIIKLIQKAINHDYKVCMWPNTFTFKDINEAVCGGLEPGEIVSIIDQNTYHGPAAQLRLTEYRRCK